MLNRVTFIGRLGKDPEVRYLENGTAVGKFSLATDENYKDREGNWQTQTEWHNIIVWRALAERAEKNLKKGKLIYLEGKLTHRSWQDQDGNTKYTTEVVANMYRMLEKRDPDQSSFPSATNEVVSQDTVEKSNTQNEAAVKEDEGADDLPF